MFTIQVEQDTHANAVHAVGNALDEYYTEALARGFAVSQNEAPEDRGQLRRSGFPPEQRGENTVAFGYTAPYAAAQEFGTDPFTPPIKPLLEWGERVAGSEDFGAAVWHKIREEGIDEKRYMRDGAQATQEWLDAHEFGNWLEDEF